MTIYIVCKKALGRVVIYKKLWLAVQMSLEWKMPRNLPIPYLLTNSQGALVFQRRNVSNLRLYYLVGNEIPSGLVNQQEGWNLIFFGLPPQLV